jgi:integrase
MYSLIKDKKSPFYQLLYTQESGKRTTISTHCKIKSDALKFLTQFKEKLREATKPAVITLKDFNAQYEEFSIMKHSKNYLRSYKSAYKILLTEFSKDIVMSKLNVTDLERFFLQRFSESKFGAHLNYRTLKAALEKAVEWNYLSYNPLKKIKMPKLPQKNVLIISQEDFQSILAHEPNSTLIRIYEFARGTGMRLSEILNLTWEQIDFTNNVITVMNTGQFTTKSKRDRIIPMSKNVIEVLLVQKPELVKIDIMNHYVFSKRGLMFNPDFISKRFKKSIRKAEVNNSYHFHHLRSSFASDLLAKGVSIFLVQKLLGHSSVAVTERNYAHLQTDSLKEAICLL